MYARFLAEFSLFDSEAQRVAVLFDNRNQMGLFANSFVKIIHDLFDGIQRVNLKSGNPFQILCC